MTRFDLTDEEWTAIEPLLPKRGRGPARKDDRKILNGIFYILRTGAPWRDLPERYGPRTTVNNRYVRWGQRLGRVYLIRSQRNAKTVLCLLMALPSRHTAQRAVQKEGTGCAIGVSSGCGPIWGPSGPVIILKR